MCLDFPYDAQLLSYRGTNTFLLTDRHDKIILFKIRKIILIKCIFRPKLNRLMIEPLLFAGNCFRCVSALFTFVSLDEKTNVLAVPQLVTRTESEKRRFAEGMQRYEIRKQERVHSATNKKAGLKQTGF